MQTIDNVHRRGVEAYKKSDSNLWVTCIAARRILGRENGATAAFASDLGRSRSQVENYAHAAELRLKLRKHVPTQVRKQLTVTHYYRMWRLQRRYNIPYSSVVEYLYEAAAERYSAESLAAMIDQEYGAGGRMWADRWEDVIKQFNHLETDTDAHPFVRRIARVALRWTG